MLVFFVCLCELLFLTFTILYLIYLHTGKYIYLNFNLVLVDAMVLDPTLYLNDTTKNTSGVNFLLPFMKRTAHKMTINKIMGRILSDLTVNGKNDYKEFRVPSLPVGCNGSSFCAGVVNTLLTFMPEYMVGIVTGHDGGTGDKKLQHRIDYIRGSRANLISSGTVLGGDYSLPYGQNGMP